MTNKTKAIGLLSALVLTVLLTQPITMSYWKSDHQLLGDPITTGSLTATLTPNSTQNPAEVQTVPTLQFLPIYPAQERRLNVALNVKGGGETLRWRYRVDVSFPPAVTSIAGWETQLQAFVTRPACASGDPAVTVSFTSTTGWIDCKYTTNEGGGSTAGMDLGIKLTASASTDFQGIALTPTFTVTVAQSVTP